MRRSTKAASPRSTSCKTDSACAWSDRPGDGDRASRCSSATAPVQPLV